MVMAPKDKRISLLGLVTVMVTVETYPKYENKELQWSCVEVGMLTTLV